MKAKKVKENIIENDEARLLTGAVSMKWKETLEDKRKKVRKKSSSS
jgi:hypothetical protein